ncbi:MAG TPA: lipase family protein [Acidimicrobiales bacterium]
MAADDAPTPDPATGVPRDEDADAATVDTDHRPPRRHRWARRLLMAAGVLVVVLVVAGALFLVLTRNPEPDDFYTPPDDLPDEPGTVLRSEPFDHGLPPGTRGWRVLYTSTDEDGDPIAVSGLVLAPREAPDGPRPVLAWAHGTTGIARPCAPSLTDRPLEGIPDLSGAIERGWVVALTDYPGLGTPGPHPYLVGDSEGRAVLDSVRAAHELDTGVDLTDDYVIWGHSQGGHAALFAGQLAADHLPEHDLAGVAAIAPATRLADNLAAIEGSEIGNVLSIFAVEAWTRYYDGLDTDVLVPRARRPAERIAAACINQPSRFRLLVDAFTLPRTVTARPIADDPDWKGPLAANAPDPGGIAAPVLVAQGLADEVVAPEVTEGWVADRCAAGAPTDFRTYPGLDHLSVVDPAGDAALAWSAERLADDGDGDGDGDEADSGDSGATPSGCPPAATVSR